MKTEGTDTVVAVRADISTAGNCPNSSDASHPPPSFGERMQAKYVQKLGELPPPGSGRCHPALLGVANLGVLAGRDDAAMLADIRGALPVGEREIPDKEIQDAIRKARQDFSNNQGGHQHSRAMLPLRPAFDGPAARTALALKGGENIDPDALRAEHANGSIIDWPEDLDGIRLLETLYAPDENLFIGSRTDMGPDCVRPVRNWIESLNRLREEARKSPDKPAACGDLLQHIIPNPLTGKSGMTMNGRASFRADSCVRKFRFAMAEFDGIPIPQQLAFWRGLGLPVVALIDTGGRSVHAWIKVSAASAADWTNAIEQGLYAGVLMPLGVDPSCKNEARLSRLPGVLRSGTGRYQRLLYLNPIGGVI